MSSGVIVPAPSFVRRCTGLCTPKEAQTGRPGLFGRSLPGNFGERSGAGLKKAKYYGVAALFLFVSVVALVPVVFMLLGSFMSSAEVTAAYGDIFSGSITQDQYAAFHLLPNQFTLEQYYQVLLRNQDFLIQFWNSVMISLPGNRNWANP